ncbi:hypothetical protein ABB37_06893 [Leptomonas pyrrhocoris]|uniref:Uncharacterized protein n=1 Tax=Leptomonas pyrrhocoris TaxID=157538 RepID=A0A0N1J4K1_LEPPY|nr:hypothetical protein ABB37_06893 [Leptomonas pyrrhocoris]KPA77508.1 hypothetical protein ABB37_06893 [Leptomonas pyrrhocoris]|eukprot:XP_015655947.1 hypothetical protein ABB37_06893 [Leptomonas pyrrhocoris]
MTFVFEACELPFDAVTEAYARHLDDLLPTHDLTHLPLWDRCMLAAVLPVVLQRGQAVVGVDPSGRQDASSRNNGNSNNNSREEADACASAHDGGDVADAAADQQIASSQRNALRRPDSPSGLPAAAATLSDIEVALIIVRQLDELEVVHDTIVSTRKAQQSTADELTASDAVGTRQPQKTSEDIMIEQLLQERFSETAPFLPDSDDESGERASEADASVVDVAMCFTANGESLGIGSSAVFGGHGYHP